jgi:hypothetical protein
MKELYVFKAILIQSLQYFVLQMCSTYEGWIDMTKTGLSEARTWKEDQDQARRVKTRVRTKLRE